MDRDTIENDSGETYPAKRVASPLLLLLQLVLLLLLLLLCRGLVVQIGGPCLWLLVVDDGPGGSRILGGGL